MEFFKITTTQAPFPVGDIRFYNNYLPSLRPDRYTLTIEQHVKVPDYDIEEKYQSNQDFLIDGPRFRVDDTAIQQRFPAESAQGAFENNLPYIVLNQKSLPWLRQIDNNPKNDTKPWVALLLFAADPSIGESLPVPTERKIADIIKPEAANIKGPMLSNVSLAEQAQFCVSIDFPSVLFNSLLPKQEALSLLTHARQVDAAYNSDSNAVDGGEWFSIVLGNRFPSGVTGIKHGVHLVSIEGWGEVLPNVNNTQASLSEYDTVRMVSLAHWEFTSMAEAGNFAAIAENLNDDLLRIQADQSVDSHIEQALHDGYVPLSTLDISGEQTAVWARGALLPFNQPYVVRSPLLSANQAKIYDKESGLFDYSYSLAWQLGRSLALSDKNFSTHLVDYRQKVQYSVSMLSTRQRLAERYRNIIRLPTNPRELIRPGIVSRGIVEHVSHTFSDKVQSKSQQIIPTLTQTGDKK